MRVGGVDAVGLGVDDGNVIGVVVVGGLGVGDGNTDGTPVIEYITDCDIEY